MDLKEFLDLLFTIIGTIGSIYVLRSITKITPELTEEISASKLGHNPDQIDSISEQKADGLIGNILVIFALIIAIINSAFDFSAILLFETRIYVIILGIIIASIIYYFISLVGKKIDHEHRKKVVMIIIRDHINRVIEKGKIHEYDYLSLKFMSERYLIANHHLSETKIDFIRRLGIIVRKEIPQNIFYEDS